MVTRSYAASGRADARRKVRLDLGTFSARRRLFDVSEGVSSVLEVGLFFFSGFLVKSQAMF